MSDEQSMIDRFRRRRPVTANELLGRKDKGEYGGHCNRTGCQKLGATWYNRVMQKYYCHECARLLNKSAADDGMEPFCTPGRPEEQAK